MKLGLRTKDSEGRLTNGTSKGDREGMFRKIGRISRKESSKASNDAE